MWPFFELRGREKDGLAAASWVPILVPPQDWRFPSPNQSSHYRQIDLCFPWFNPNFWFHLLSISNLAESNPQKNFQDVIDDSHNIYIICTSCSIYFRAAIACSMKNFTAPRGSKHTEASYQSCSMETPMPSSTECEPQATRSLCSRILFFLVPSGKLTVGY